jgi:Ca2+-binding RTX toxin-like protein
MAVVIGSDGNDIFFGSVGPDELNGRGGNDILFGNGGIDRLNGGADNDILFGGDGDDELNADGGNDIAIGGAGNDTASGGAGNDILLGEDGNDRLSGGAGLDIVNGGAGADRLSGGGGSDILLGGGGADRFVLDGRLNSKTNVDTIGDFSTRDDRLELDNAVFGGLSEGGLSASAFVTGRNARDAGDRIIYDRSSGKLYFDADGTGSAAKVLFAVLDNKPSLDAGDFIVG